MAYATTNPPVCMISRVGSGPALWIYRSTDAHTDVDAADYFSNGDALGMKVNDIILVGDTSTPSGTMHLVTAVTSGGAASISTATLA